MAATTRYVLLTVDAHDPNRFELEGVFMELPAALAYARELNKNNGIPRAQQEIEGWRGRDFQGCWNHEGKLIEDRKGRSP